MQNSWYGVIASQQGAGTAVTNTTSATTVLGAGAKPLQASMLLLNVGQGLHVSAGGVISTAASTPGTLTWSFLYGAVVIAAGAASPTVATSASGLPWKLDLDITVKTIAAGVASACSMDGLFTSAALSATVPIQILQQTTGTSFDNSLSVAFDLQVTWSVANASNSIQATRYDLTFKN